ncbi:hypothetical protein SmJEL517_g02457 [Synchytrium microbalum]|uniref:Endo-beta-1,6-galactanase-like domain-containing protein n=1 Tax=Synchytrium microbalum TaxID=1806994 RepID=A0A507C1V7_9FUNG|nr:uncharacterized protein SmJEL517_g02457 [Synchytrium microbalum]TPX35107.1 hypothetical protein SmJEL517_g02457 [Synchytrium microbalum]
MHTSQRAQHSQHILATVHSTQTIQEQLEFNRPYKIMSNPPIAHPRSQILSPSSEMIEMNQGSASSSISEAYTSTDHNISQPSSPSRSNVTFADSIPNSIMSHPNITNNRTLYETPESYSTTQMNAFEGMDLITRSPIDGEAMGMKKVATSVWYPRPPRNKSLPLPPIPIPEAVNNGAEMAYAAGGSELSYGADTEASRFTEASRDSKVGFNSDASELTLVQNSQRPTVHLSTFSKAVARLTSTPLPPLDDPEFQARAQARVLLKYGGKPKNPRAVCIRRTLLALVLGVVVLAGVILLVLYFTNAKVRSALGGTYAPYFNATVTLLDSNFVNGTDWLGFGTSLSWWARFVGETMNGTSQFEALMDSVFDVNKGLGLTVVRYNIGGTQAGASGFPPYYGMPAVQQYEGGPYNFDLDYGQRYTLLASLKRGIVAIELFLQSPPWWMTNSGSSKGNYDGSDNLSSSKYSLAADYLVNTIKYYRDNYGLNFFSVAPFSEPTASWWADNAAGRQEGCHFDLSSVASFTSVLNSTLQANNLSTPIASTDDVAYSNTQASLQGLSSKQIAQIGKVNTHGYFDPPNSERASFGQVVQKYGKKAWMSELGTAGQAMLPDVAGIRNLGGIGLARQIVADIYYIGVTAWVYWQAVDVAGGWGLISLPNGVYNASFFNNMPTPGKQYYVMMQYSKWLRPGMDIVASDQGSDVAVIVGRSVSQKSMVVVALNAYSYDRVFGIDISGYALGVNATAAANVTISAYRTSDTENHAPIAAPQYGSNSVISLYCPPNSVTTVIVNDLTWKKSS